jgi:MFS family permease
MTESSATASQSQTARIAFRFVFLFGIINLFADMTYEGGRGIAGPFLGSLGASAAVVGFVAGFGELMGYALRSIWGYFGDKTHRYWLMIFIGYAVNMLAVPALALAGNWPVAAALLIAERTGRGIRKPNVDAMLSHAAKSLGSGWVFGLNEALDQTGATIGPLITALVLYLKGGYHLAFAALLISAVLCLVTLAVARMIYPRPHELESRQPHMPSAEGQSSAYWKYLIGAALIAAGFADFSLAAFHFRRVGTVPEAMIPVFYAVAMATGAISALVLGWLYDRYGRVIVLLAFILPVLFAPLVFLGGFALALLGVFTFGIGIGAQDALLKAALVGMIPREKRATAFGVFDTAFGIAWFAGSAIMGLLYNYSIPALVTFSVVLQLAALPILLLGSRKVEGS